jgi:hypothetical protein
MSAYDKSPNPAKYSAIRIDVLSGLAPRKTRANNVNAAAQQTTATYLVTRGFIPDGKPPAPTLGPTQRVSEKLKKIADNLEKISK